jgi:hypothetical protein
MSASEGTEQDVSFWRHPTKHRGRLHLQVGKWKELGKDEQGEGEVVQKRKRNRGQECRHQQTLSRRSPSSVKFPPLPPTDHPSLPYI